MSSRMAGALLGFLAGVIGYIVFRYWIFPIRRYQRLKSKIAKDILDYQETISENNWNSKNLGKKRLKSTRKNMSELLECFNEEIPLWYRIKLKSRGESPPDTARHLMGLNDVREAEYAETRLKKAKTTLLLE